MAGVEGGWRVFKFEGLQGVDDDPRDGHVAVPLAVGRDDKPGSMLVARGGDEGLVGVLVPRPELALLEVGLVQLPVLVGGVDAGLQAASLLLVGDVQEKLEDDDVVVEERALELVDVFEAAPDGLGGDELVDPRREDVLVVRAVEDADHAARGNGLVNAPEKIVACFEGRWDLEGGYVAALGIDAGEDVADRAVL